MTNPAVIIRCFRIHQADILVARLGTIFTPPLWKQTEIVTLAVKMGELSLVLRSLQDPADEERDAAGGDDATAQLGDSFTHDSQVSRLIRDPNPPPKPPDAMKTSVFVLRGNRGTKQELDGSVASDPNGPPPSESEGAKPNTPTTSSVNGTACRMSLYTAVW